MPIRQTTPRAALQRSIDRRTLFILRKLVERLCFIGEEVVRHARTLPSPNPKHLPTPIPPHKPHYIDWTHNLRSSIGYVVLWDGKVMQESDFEQLRGGRKSKLSGSRKGREFLHKLIEENGSGLVLIVVAGMPYAAYVEALGYDVLGSAEIKAGEMVKRMLSKLRF